MKCAWCHKPKRLQFYCGKRVPRCPCNHDYRTPVEVRRDAVLEKYGDDPEGYTAEVLAELAREGLFDITSAFCPAGKLTPEQMRERERRNLA